MQFDPYIRHLHVLFFETEAAALAAHSHVVALAASQFADWSVQAGGQRVFVVLDRPAPGATWRYLFVTLGPLTSIQMHRIHLATMADEALWNQV